MKLHTASSMNVERLYHYQPYDQARLAQVVVNRELYFSNPKDFNDPWDCRPWFDSKSVHDPEVLNRHAAWYAKITRRLRPDIPDTEVERRADHIRKNPDWLKDRLAECSTEIQADIQKRYRVYCLGSRSDNELMWAHCTGKHTGLSSTFEKIYSHRRFALAT